MTLRDNPLTISLGLIVGIAFMLTTMPAMADTVYLKYCPALSDQCQLATYQCTNAWIPPDVRDCKPTGEFVWIDKIGEENNLR